MKSLFFKIEPFSTSILGKKDKKSINNVYKEEILDKTLEHKVTKCKNKASIITIEDKALLFHYGGKYYPTVKFLGEKNVNMPCVYVDDGAIGPIQRGSNVMAPGIYKYIDKVTEDFTKGSPVIIKLVGGAVLGIGTALLNKKDITKATNGEAVEVLHHSGDDLFKSYQ